MAFKTPSLVKETSASTGTAAFTLDGAVTGHRTFSGAGIATDTTDHFPYVIRAGAEYEFGIGTLGSATTLNRNTVIESSNAGALVDWAAGTKTVYVARGGANRERGYNLFEQTSGPTGNNASSGFALGSVFGRKDTYSVGTGLNLYIAGGQTGSGNNSMSWVWVGGNAAGAMWDAAGTGPSKLGVSLGYNDDTSLTQDTDGVVGLGQGGKARWPGMAVHGLGWGSGDYGSHQGGHVGGIKETTDATPTVLDISGAGAFLTIEPDSVAVFEGVVVARDNTTPDWAAWSCRVMVEKTGASDPTIVAGATFTSIGASAGAAAWAAGASIDTTNDALQIDLTGAAAKTIRWTGYLRLTQVAFA